MSSSTWITIAGLAAATFVVKASAPLFLGGRTLPPSVLRVMPLLASALFAALIAVDTFAAAGRSLTVDARAGGLLAAAIAIRFRAPIVLVVVAAVLVTALLRAVS